MNECPYNYTLDVDNILILDESSDSSSSNEDEYISEFIDDDEFY